MERLSNGPYRVQVSQFLPRENVYIYLYIKNHKEYFVDRKEVTLIKWRAKFQLEIMSQHLSRLSNHKVPFLGPVIYPFKNEDHRRI